MRILPGRLSAFSILIATLFSCGGDDVAGTGSTSPTTGSLRVTTQSGGVGADPDGYLLSLDGAAQGEIGDPAPVVVAGLPAGQHRVALSGVVPFCAVDGQASRSITVSAGDTADVAFTVICRATGTLEVTVSSSGGTPDPDGYAVNVDGAAGLPIAPNGTLNVALVGGSHAITLSGLAFNCQVADSSRWSGSLSPGAATPVRFAVTCGTLPPWTALFQGWREGGDEYHGQWDVFAVDVASGAVTDLTQSRGRSEEGAVLSPDRTKVLFAFTDDWDPGVAVVNVDGTGFRRLTASVPGSSVPHSPTWSPDGSKIALTRGDSLLVINADGSGERYLGPFGVAVSWAPDGTHLVAVGGSTNLNPYIWNPDIWVVPVGGGAGLNLTSSQTPEIEAVWSPDGQRLAFTRRTPRGGGPYYEDVWVMQADGSDLLQLTESSGAPDFGGARRPHWSPDGKVILFEQSGATYETDLYTIRPDGTGLTNLTHTHDISETYADWAPDGSRIIFAAGADPGGGSDDVFTMNPDGSNRTNLSNHGGVDIP